MAIKIKHGGNVAPAAVAAYGAGKGKARAAATQQASALAATAQQASRGRKHATAQAARGMEFQDKQRQHQQEFVSQRDDLNRKWQTEEAEKNRIEARDRDEDRHNRTREDAVQGQRWRRQEHDYRITAEQREELNKIEQSLDRARRSGEYTEEEMNQFEAEAHLKRAGIQPIRQEEAPTPTPQERFEQGTYVQDGVTYAIAPDGKVTRIHEPPKDTGGVMSPADISKLYITARNEVEAASEDGVVTPEAVEAWIDDYMKLQDKLMKRMSQPVGEEVEKPIHIEGGDTLEGDYGEEDIAEGSHVPGGGEGLRAEQSEGPPARRAPPPAPAPVSSKPSQPPPATPPPAAPKPEGPSQPPARETPEARRTQERAEQQQRQTAYPAPARDSSRGRHEQPEPTLRVDRSLSEMNAAAQSLGITLERAEELRNVGLMTNAQAAQYLHENGVKNAWEFYSNEFDKFSDALQQQTLVNDAAKKAGIEPDHARNAMEFARATPEEKQAWVEAASLMLKEAGATAEQSDPFEIRRQMESAAAILRRSTSRGIMPGNSVLLTSGGDRRHRDRRNTDIQRELNKLQPEPEPHRQPQAEETPAERLARVTEMQEARTAAIRARQAERRAEAERENESR